MRAFFTIIITAATLLAFKPDLVPADLHERLSQAPSHSAKPLDLGGNRSVHDVLNGNSFRYGA